MNYSEFKKIIESETKVDAVLYDKLVSRYGKNYINNLFERYLNDTEVVNDEEKMKRTSYYIDVTTVVENNSESQFVQDDGNNIDLDSMKMYLKEIQRYPLLTDEEEISLGTKLAIMRDKIKSISIENIDNNLQKWGFKSISNVTSLSEKIYFLDSLINKITNQNDNFRDFEEVDEMLSTLKDLKALYEYHQIIEKFMKANLRLVVSIAKNYRGHNVDFLDLIQEGNIGLSKAIEKFEIDKGFKFSTYATWWIRQAVGRAVADQGKTIRIPVHLYELITKISTTEKDLESVYYRKPTDDELVAHFELIAKKELEEEGIKSPTKQEIAKKTKINLKKLKKIRKYTQDAISLDTPLGDEESATLADYISDDMNVEEITINNLIQEFVSNVLPEACTDKRKLLIILLRFGLNVSDYLSFKEFKDAISNAKYSDLDIKKLYIYYSVNTCNKATLEEIGDVLNISRERVRQIEKTVTRKLRTNAKVKTGYGLIN